MTNTIVFRKLSSEEIKNKCKNSVYGDNSLSPNVRFWFGRIRDGYDVKINSTFSTYEKFRDFTLGLYRNTPLHDKAESYSTRERYQDCISSLKENIKSIDAFIAGDYADFDLLSYQVLSDFVRECLNCDSDTRVFEGHPGIYTYVETNAFELNIEKGIVVSGKDAIIDVCKGVTPTYRVYDKRGRYKITHGWSEDFEWILNDMFEEYGDDMLVSFE